MGESRVVSEMSSTDAQRRTHKVAILGFGTVGSSVARILCDLEPRSVELASIFNRNVARKRADWVPGRVYWTESIETVLDSDADVVVELAGGLDPAGGWVRRALEGGKSVVTANKQLIAKHGVELEAIAKRRGVHLLYGAAVAGGVPIIPALQQGLAGDSFDRIEGILNGTCNFILSGMEDGAEFRDVLAEAQARGFAESDPTEDVAGLDARAKLTILARLALGVEIEPTDVPARSIAPVSAIDFAYAQELKCTIRQISRAELRNGVVLATVAPMLVPRQSPFAWSRGTENMVVVTGKYGGDTVFSGHGAGGHPTAVAVVSDILTIAHGSKTVEIASRKARVSGELLLRHYIRFVVSDRPGIVAEIAGGLARQRINIDALLQKPGYPQARLPFVMTVEPCATSSLREALSEISRMECLIEPPLDLQILEPESAAV